MSADNYWHDDSQLFYVTENCPGVGCDEEMFSYQLMGCNCSVTCSPSACPCMLSHHHSDPSIKSIHSSPVQRQDGVWQWRRECGGSCSCSGGKCVSRVVQRGARAGLQVYDTGDERGLGLRSLSDIAANQFVCCYAGEVIGAIEAHRRRQTVENRFSQSEVRSTNFIMAVHEHYGGGERRSTFIDATRVANIGRYVNHSCRPNMRLEVVRVDTLVPHVAMFTNRRVSAGEQLTYSYGTISGRDASYGGSICADNSWTDPQVLPNVATRPTSCSDGNNRDGHEHPNSVMCITSGAMSRPFPNEFSGDCRSFYGGSILPRADTDKDTFSINEYPGDVSSPSSSSPAFSTTRCFCGEDNCSGWLPGSNVVE